MASLATRELAFLIKMTKERACFVIEKCALTQTDIDQMRAVIQGEMQHRQRAAQIDLEDGKKLRNENDAGVDDDDPVELERPCYHHEPGAYLLYLLHPRLVAERLEDVLDEGIAVLLKTAFHGFNVSLRLFASLLRLAPPNQTFRDFIAEFLKRGLPEKITEQREQVLTFVSTHASVVLDMKNEEAADHLETVEKVLLTCCDVLRMAPDQSDETKVPETFVFDDQEWPFPDVQTKLLTILQHRGIDKPVPEEDVLIHVYDTRSEKKRGRLRQLQSDTNESLLCVRLPLRITRPKSRHLSLQRTTDQPDAPSAG